jgi:hypothetical protein
VRAFFLFLVLLNLIYFAVGDFLAPAASAPDSPPGAAAALPAGVQPLQMVASASAAAVETTPQNTPVAAASTTVPVQADKVSPQSAKPPPRCYSLGPFDAKPPAEAMVATFAKQNVDAKVREIQQTQVTGYWIYLPPYPSTAAATAANRKLGAKGLHDYYVVASPPNANAVSLGLFRERSGAERRMARVRKMGFQPKMQVRTSDKQFYWLDYRDPGNGAVGPGLWADAGGNSGTLQRVRRSCPAG